MRALVRVSVANGATTWDAYAHAHVEAQAWVHVADGDYHPLYTRFCALHSELRGSKQILEFTRIFDILCQELA